MNRQVFLWKEQEKHKEFENINHLMYKLANLQGFILEPIILGEVFYRKLQKIKQRDKNKQTANNMLKVFTILCQFNYINGKIYKNEKSFSISPKIWSRNCIGRNALETSLKHLKEINLIDYTNSCYKGQCDKRKRFYSLNRIVLETLYKEAEKILDEESQTDFALYEEFLEYTNHKDFKNDYQEEQAFKEYKRQRKCGAIKVAPKEIKNFQKNLENLEEII